MTMEDNPLAGTYRNKRNADRTIAIHYIGDGFVCATALHCNALMHIVEISNEDLAAKWVKISEPTAADLERQAEEHAYMAQFQE